MFLNFLLFVSVKLSKPSRGILYFFTIAKCRESPICFLKFFLQIEQKNSDVDGGVEDILMLDIIKKCILKNPRKYF